MKILIVQYEYFFYVTFLSKLQSVLVGYLVIVMLSYIHAKYVFNDTTFLDLIRSFTYLWNTWIFHKYWCLSQLASTSLFGNLRFSALNLSIRPFTSLDDLLIGFGIWYCGFWFLSFLMVYIWKSRWMVLFITCYRASVIIICNTLDRKRLSILMLKIAAVPESCMS